MTTTWRRVDPSSIALLQNAFQTDSMAPSCMRAIENRLLSSGILFTTLDYSKRTSDAFQAHINLHFVRFLRQALNTITVCGWCFFVIENDIPRVIPIGMLDVRWRLNSETLSIEMAMFRPNEELPATDILSIIDTPVDGQGRIESLMSSYIRTRSLYDSFLRNTLQADRQLACPNIYTQSKTDQVFDERDITNTGEVEGLRARLVGTELNMRNKLSVNRHAFNEALVRELNTRPMEDVRQERTDRSTGLANFDANAEDPPQRIIPLPMDAQIAQAPRPQARTDIVSILKHFESLACVAFGVNSESVGADTRSGGHMGAQALERVNIVTAETTQKWARLFEPALVQIYNLIWGSGSEDAAEDEADGTQVEVTVIFPSTLPSATIERLYASRVLSHAAYISYAGQVIQLPRSAFETKDYRLSDAP